jgi:hypothetical protein
VNEIGKWLWMELSAHFVTGLWMVLIGVIGYLFGLANPLYCARCRKHMRAEEIFRRRNVG